MCRAPYLRALDGPHALNGPARAPCLCLCAQRINISVQISACAAHTRTREHVAVERSSIAASPTVVVVVWCGVLRWRDAIVPVGSRCSGGD